MSFITPRKQSKVNEFSLLLKESTGMTNQEKIAAQNGRTRLCRHFLRGTCTEGDNCTYCHDISVMKPDDQKVFIGGIPRNCTSRQVIKAVNDAGFKVLNIPKCHPSGFTPKVCLESVAKAKALLKMARVEVEGVIADVRKFTDSRSTNRDNMCVTVSGLPLGATGKDLMEGLAAHGFIFDRTPLVNPADTFCQRLELATVEMADALVALETVRCSNMGCELTITQYGGRKARRSVRPPMAQTRSMQSTSWSARQGEGGKCRQSFLNRAMTAPMKPSSAPVFSEYMGM